ncbi:periplasmic binding protein-like I [Absidia repens]|uniref:Periplasmic binding protein-like I n=1 Tax=Absidia repens TaxID=90262 RepID=A0A1X2IFX5_9FUNG|nr:periplasmic binding protein-like I [Absidia repens]
MNSAIQLTSNSIKNLAPSSSVTRAIDDNDVDTTRQQIFHDVANNFTFTLTRKNGTAFISPLETTGLTELKVGVLLPFHQKDNEWTKTITLSGASAIRMAVAEINTGGLIPGAYITLIEQDSYPKEVDGQAAITQAIYSTVSLVHEGVIAVIGDISSSWTSLSALMTSTLDIPQCSFSASATALSDKTQYHSFFRTIPTDLIYADAAFSFISSQGWTTIGVLYSGDDFGKQLSKDIIMKARDHNIAIIGYQSFFDGEPTSNIQNSVDSLMETGARVIFVAATDDAPLAALVTAAHSGYINNDNVWLTIGVDTNELHQSVLSFNNILSLRANNSSEITHSNSSNSSGVDALTYVAQTTQKLTPIQYNSSFSGGVFGFDAIVSLPGYPPFDNFLQKWASLDPSL